MDMSLRVVQRYRLDKQDEREYTGYALQVRTGNGWVTVPVVEVAEGEQVPG